MISLSLKSAGLGLAIVLICVGTAAYSQTYNNASNSESDDQATSAEPTLPASLLIKEDEDAIVVVVSVNVPRNRGAKDNFVLSPYPLVAMKRPEMLNLPLDFDQLKEIIKRTIYFRWRNMPEDVPDWRIDGAFTQALKKSGKHMPGNEIGLDAWIDNFLPFMAVQIKEINLKEKARKARYELMAEVPDDFRLEAEKNAKLQQRIPMAVRVGQIRRGLRQGRVKVLPGTWWLVGTHAVAGMIYYWQEEFEIMNGPRLLELNEDNALIIQGHI